MPWRPRQKLGDTSRRPFAESTSLPLLTLRQQEANSFRPIRPSRPSVSRNAESLSKLPTLQHSALQATKRDTVARVAKLQETQEIRDWRMDPRPGVYNELSHDLAAQTFSGSTWGVAVDLDKVEAAERKRMEKMSRRRAVLHRPAHVHISFGDRKSFQQSGLAADKQFVAQRIACQASEHPETKQARMQILNEHWLQAVFAPIPNPRETLMPEILVRVQTARDQEVQAEALPQSRSASKDSSQEQEELEFEATELASIVHVCRQFHALSTMSARDTGPEVLDRPAFCRLCCAFDGFRSMGRPRLARSVAHFDREATQVTVQSGSGTNIEVLGVRLSKDGYKKVEADAPIALLFKALIVDMLVDQGWEREDKARRASMKRNVRSWFFEILLPAAQEYAQARQDILQARVGRAVPESPAEPSPEAVPEEVEVASEGEEETQETEDPAEKARRQNELYAHTFVVLKGENLLCQLMEPEVLVLMPQLSAVFGQLFEAYADLPMPDGSGSMSLKGLLRCCCDFDLFPDRVDYKTILFIYNSAEGCLEVNVAPPVPQTPDTGSPQKKTMRKSRSRTWSGANERSGSKGAGPRKSRKPKNSSGKGDTRNCILFHGKWIKEHLTWIAKPPEAMSPAELRAIAILSAAGNWMESQCLTAAELLAYFDDDGNGALSADELSIAIQFMSFEHPPTKEEIEDVYSRIVPPSAAELDLETLGMAFLAVSKKEEANSGAANVMVKDMAKMSKEQSNAAIFFREIMQYLQNSGCSPADLYSKLDEDSAGALTGRELTQRFTQLIKMTGKGSPALSLELDNALLLLDPQGIQTFGKADFCKLLSQVKRADRVRQMSKNAHPLFLATAEAAPASGTGGTQTRRVFGPVAFMECMLKIGLEHLSYHGNATQQALPTAQKLLWLVAFLTWSFEAAKVRAAARPGTESRGPSRASERAESRGVWSASSRTQSRQRLQEAMDGRPYPKFLAPLQRLVARHPSLFLDALKEPAHTSAQPEWATPGDGADVLLQSCTELVQKEREQKEAFVPFDRLLLRLAASGATPQ